MTVKTTISENDFAQILSNYDLGEYKSFEKFANGAGQTTALLITTTGKYVLRYYENRAEKHVLFEVNLFNYLREKQYPVPAIVKNLSDEFYGIYKNKPYIIIEYIEGEHLHNPNEVFNKDQVSKVVEVIARLHILTENYNQEWIEDREVYNPNYCLQKYQNQSRATDKEAREEWLKKELAQLEFPVSLTNCICHADVNYGNFLFRNGEIVAVLDFDMSFYTYIVYDIASLIYWWAFPPKDGFKDGEASFIATEYLNHHDLSELEKNHIYDALKLIILLGISWSDESDFEEGKKAVDQINEIGRDGFYRKLFK